MLWVGFEGINFLFQLDALVSTKQENIPLICQLVGVHDSELERGLHWGVQGLRPGLIMCLQLNILCFKKCTHGITNTAPERMPQMCVGARVCACAPSWQPLDRSKASMMNRHLAQGSALAQWAVNLPLPLSACGMLNKVIWIFVILMCQRVKSPLEPNGERKYGRIHAAVSAYRAAAVRDELKYPTK